MNTPLVSVVVPTKNSSPFLEACLQSVQNQHYKNIELLVIDNGSHDNTKEIARKYTDQVYDQGPERSAQRNFGAQKAHGEYIVFIDSDMELTRDVIRNCVELLEESANYAGIVIPEQSFGKGFWAKCKKLEKSFYVGVPWMEAARFFRKSVFEAAGGYDENMVSGEDWDLSQRIAKIGPLTRVHDYIRHNEGRISLLQTMKKKAYYAGQFARYTAQNQNEPELKSQTGVWSRYKLFLSRPSKLLERPLVGTGMLFMKSCEFTSGGISYLLHKIKR